MKSLIEPGELREKLKNSKFFYFYRKTIVKSWGTEKMNQFGRTSSKLWVLESSVMPKS